MSSGQEQVTYAACLSPASTGAIATLALRGPDAWTIVRQLFRPLSTVTDLTPERGRFWLGRLGQDLADEVVLAVKQAAPVPWLEVHCHGGREVIRLLLEAFEAHGVRVKTWQDLERLTTPDRGRTLAAVALVEALTPRTAAILLDQHHGALDQALAATRAALDRADTDAAGQLLAELVRYANLGRHLTRPWHVAVAGAPNVGKSSLVNALAGYQRSVVAATPGTTRDVVTTLIALDGWPVELSDTAGLREGGETLEGLGIERARAVAAAADLCLWVLDTAVAPVWPPVSSDRLQLVVNKMDLPAAWDLEQAAGAVYVSAQTGAGLGELCQLLAARLVPQPPPAGAAVPFTASLADCILEAHHFSSTGQWERARQVLETVPGPI